MSSPAITPNLPQDNFGAGWSAGNNSTGLNPAPAPQQQQQQDQIPPNDNTQQQGQPQQGQPDNSAPQQGSGPTVDLHGEDDGTQGALSGNGNGGNIFSRMYNTLGKDQTPSFSVDDTGHLVAAANDAAPGSFFKNLLVGALTGMSSAAKAGPRGGFLGAVGNGFTGAMTATQKQNQQNRTDAIQNFVVKQAQTKAEQAAQATKLEQAKTAASVTYLNAQSYGQSLQNAKLSQAERNTSFSTNQSVLDSFGTSIQKNIPFPQAQKMMADDRSHGYTVMGAETGETPRLDADGNPVMDPNSGVPETDPQTGEQLKDANGNVVMKPGTQQPIMDPLVSISRSNDQNGQHILSDTDVKLLRQGGQITDDGNILPGQSMSSSDFNFRLGKARDTIHNQMQLDAFNAAQQKQKTDQQEATAKVNLTNAQTGEANAAAAHSNAETRQTNATTAQMTGAGTGTGAAGVNPTTGANDAYLSTLSPANRATVQAIGEGRSPLAASRSGKPSPLQLMVNQAYPDYDATRFTTYQATRKDFTSGKTAQQINSLNTALGHLDDMVKSASYSSTLPGVSAVERFTGNQNAQNYDNARNGLVSEIHNAYQAGAMTNQDEKRWNSQIGSWSPAEVRTQGASLVTLIGSKLQALQNQWNNGAAPGARSQVQVLNPRSQSIVAWAKQMQQGTPLANVDNPQQGGQPQRNAPATPSLTNIKVNPSTGQRIGWNGSAWVDASTGQPHSPSPAPQQQNPQQQQGGNQ